MCVCLSVCLRTYVRARAHVPRRNSAPWIPRLVESLCFLPSEYRNRKGEGSSVKTSNFHFPDRPLLARLRVRVLWGRTRKGRGKQVRVSHPRCFEAWDSLVLAPIVKDSERLLISANGGYISVQIDCGSMGKFVGKLCQNKNGRIARSAKRRLDRRSEFRPLTLAISSTIDISIASAQL